MSQTLGTKDQQQNERTNHFLCGHTAGKQFKQVGFVQIYKLWLFVPDCID